MFNKKRCYLIPQQRILDRLKEIFFITAYSVEDKEIILKKFKAMRMNVIFLYRDLGGEVYSPKDLE